MVYRKQYVLLAKEIQMAEKIRVRCPVCGQMTDLEQMEKAEEDKPTEVRLFLQKFGGKVASEDQGAMLFTKKKRGSAKGFIEYLDITKTQPEEVAKLKTWFDKRVKEYLKEDK